MLTNRQKKILMFFDAHWVQYGCGPSTRQVMRHLDLESRGRIHQDIVELCDRNLLHKLSNVKARCYLPNLPGRFYPWS